MKKLLLLLLTIVTIGFLAAPLSAQETVVIGEGTATSTYLPSYSLYNYSLTQQIYTSEEIGMAGTISSVAFYNSGSEKTRSYTMYMVTTDKESFASTTDWITVTASDQVFTGTVTMTAGAWITFDLDTPFEYDGSSNLAIIMDDNTGSWSGGLSCYVFDAPNMALRVYSDGTNYDPFNPSSYTGTVMNVKNQIKLGITPGGDFCGSVTGLTASNNTTNSITLSFQPKEDHTSWTLSYHPVDDTDNVTTTTLATTNYTVTGLESDVLYEFHVAANCSNGLTSSAKTVTAFTLPTDPATLPYSCDFEDATENSNWTFYNGNAANQWIIGNATDFGGTQSMYISNDGQHNAYYFDSASVVYAVRDIYLDPSYDYYNIRFSYKSEGWQDADYFRFYLGHSPQHVQGNNTGTLVGPANSVYYTSSNSGNYGQTPEWRNFSANLDTTWRGNTIRMYFVWRNDALNGMNPPIAIDKIHVTGHTCTKPYNVHIYDSIPNTLTITWSDSTNASGYELALLPYYGVDPESAFVSVVGDTSYTFTDVPNNMFHSCWIRCVCGTEKSGWSIYNMGVQCAPISTLPYTESFDTYGTGTTTHPTCWFDTTSYTSTAYPYVNNTQRASGVGSLYFYSTSTHFSYAVMPEIDVNALEISNLMLSLKALKTANTYGHIDVGVMTDPHNLSTFTLVKSFLKDDYSANNVWQDFDIYFDQYTGEGSYIAIRTPNDATNYVFVDDIVLQEIPECTKPYNLTVSNVTHESFKLNWSNYIDAPAYEVAIVSPAGADMETATITTVSSTHATLTDLQDNTNYQVFVRAACGSSTTEWAGPVSVHTKCIPTSDIPYTESFDEFGSSSSGAAYFPNCWTRHTNSSTEYPYINTTNHSDGTSALYFYTTTGTPNTYCMATTQALDLSQGDAENYLLTFKLKKTSAGYGRMDVGIMTDPDDNYTLTVLKSIYPDDMSDTTDWVEFSVVVPAQDEITYIAFIAPQGTTNTVYLDEVKLDVATCSSPSNLTVSEIAGASAMVSWEAAPISVEEYTMEYKEEEEEDWTEILTEETSLLLTGLSQATTYNVRVYSNCTEGNADTLTTTFTTSVYLSCTVPDTLGVAILGSDSTTGYYNPIGNFFKYSYTQQIYTADEINPEHTPTAITGMSLKYAYGTPMTDKTNVDVYLAHRTDSTFASTTDWTPISEATLVYHGPLNCSQGWNMFEFDQPFSYNGTSNLVLIVDDNSFAYNGSAYVFNTHTKTNASIYKQSDTENQNPANPGTGARSDKRPTIKFYTCDEVVPVTCIVPNIYNYTSDNENITVSWSAGDEETSWELRYKAADETDWTTTTVSTSPYTLDNLTANTEYTVEMRSICSGGDFSNWTGFTTATTCDPIELPFNEDFESATGTGNACFVQCWTRGSTNYPYVVSTQYVSGEKSLYFYGTSSTYCYAATPRFSDEVLMDSLHITFQARKSTDSYFIEVGMMTDPNDYSTFQVIGSYTPSAINTWEMGEFNTSGYTGTGQYVAFRIPQWYTSGMFVDDIHIDYIPSCLHVENIHATSITSDSATITWTPGGDETEWLYVYGPSGTLNVDYLEDGDYEPISDNTVVLGDLEGNSPYDILIKASCGNGETSTPMLYSFRTACVSISTLPYIENFDNWGVTSSSTTATPGPMPACWERITNYTYPYPFCNSSYHYNGTSALYFYGSNTYNEIAVCPEISEDLDITNLQLQFMCRTYSSSYNGRLIIGVMDSPTGDFTPVDTVTTTSDAWHQENILFNNYTGTGKYIALKFAPPTSSFTYFMLDNLVIDVAPSCDAPTNLTLNTLTSSTVSYTWEDDADQGSWEVLLVPASVSNPDFSAAETVSSNSFSASDLSNNKSYTLYVRTVCSNGEGNSNWVTANFTTLIADPIEIPYYHDFEDAEENAAWGRINGTQVNKWYIGMPEGENDSVLFVSNNGTTETYTITTTANVWAYRDFIFNEAPGFKVSFSWKCVGEATYDYLKVFVGEPEAVTAGSVTPPASAVAISGMLESDSTWQHFEADLSSSNSNMTRRLYFLWHNDAATGANPAAVIDSISITTVSCGVPYNLAVTELDDQSATVTFSPATQQDNAWQYVIGTGDFVPSDTMEEIPQAVQSTTIQLSGLTNNTHYVIYVRTSCGDNEFSAWSEGLEFHTDCGEIAIPYSENFNSYATTATTAAPSTYPNDVLPDCWQFINRSTSSSTYPIVYISSSSTYAVSGNCLFFKSSYTTPLYAVLPHFADALNTLQITFTYRNESSSATNGILSLGYMTNPADESTFTLISSYPVTTTQTEITEMLGSIPADAANGYLAFKYMGQGSSSNMYLGLDNILVEALPACPRPSAVEVTASTTNAISLSWVSNGSESAWEIAYGAPGFNPDSTTATVIPANSNPFTVENLTSATSYEFYVRAVCGTTDHSNWSSSVIGTTQCDVFSQFPYTESFEDGLGCWHSNPVTGTTDWLTQGYYYSSTGTTGANPVEGNSIAYIKSTSRGNVTDLISPIFDLSSLTDPYITFYQLRKLWVNDLDTLQIYYKTSASADPVLLASYSDNLTNWEFDSIALPNPSAEYQIIFRGFIEWGYGIGIDAITINGTGSGPVIITDPTVATATAAPIAQTTAQLNATITNPDGVEITAKGFKWMPLMGEDYSTVAATTSTDDGFSATLNDLTPNTDYIFHAFIVFNGDTVSGNDLTFTTLPEDVQPCDVPTGLAASNITHNSFTVTWNAVPDASYTLRYRPAQGQWTSVTPSTNSHELTSLAAETTYEVQVQADCGGDNVSAWSESLNVTTLEDGIPTYLLNSIALYPNPAKEYVDIRVDNEVNVNLIEVYDVYGKLVNTVNVVENPTRINVSGLANGMYFVRVSTDAGAVTKTFVKK